LIDLTLVLEGPNEKSELLEVKKFLEVHHPQGYLLIDGSIDRQFVAHPEISDSFYFALLQSDRQEQLKKSQDLLLPLGIPVIEEDDKKLLAAHLGPEIKSLLFDLEKKELRHRSGQIPFLDRDLLAKCLKQKNSPTLLYLGGALTKSLYTFLAPFKGFRTVLHNFTLFQNISVYKSGQSKFNPKLFLLNPVVVERIFLNIQSPQALLPIPSGIKVHNLYREDPDEIRI
ncbi:MAG: hypothetical protein WCG27_12660, partial [Pseudomonadota bacterium]